MTISTASRLNSSLNFRLGLFAGLSSFSCFSCLSNWTPLQATHRPLSGCPAHGGNSTPPIIGVSGSRGELQTRPSRSCASLHTPAAQAGRTCTGDPPAGTMANTIAGTQMYSVWSARLHGHAFVSDRMNSASARTSHPTRPSPFRRRYRCIGIDETPRQRFSTRLASLRALRYQPYRPAVASLKGISSSSGH